MSQRSLVDELKLRFEYIPRMNLILSIILMIPPFSIIGVVMLLYELHLAGKRIKREEEDEAIIEDESTVGEDHQASPGSEQ